MKKYYMQLLSILLLGMLLITTPTGLLFAQDSEFDIVLEEEDTSDDHGGSGSFGRQLSNIGNFISLNAFVTNELHIYQSDDRPSTFDQHYFNILATGRLNERIEGEIQLEYEHGGEVIEVRYAHVDISLLKNNDALILRTGKFLTPAGEFNEYLYPEYLNKVIHRAFVNREIVPSAWGEVGIQLRGRLAPNDSSTLTPYYAVYVVNGLEGNSGNGIRGLRGNNRDQQNDHKAFGGQIGLEIGSDINISANYYNGVYSPDGELGLQILGFSGHYDNGALSFYGAFHMARQEAYGVNNSIGTLNKAGFYAQLAYRTSMGLEPIIRYDQIRLDATPEGDRNRFMMGVNYHIFRNAVAKCQYEFISDQGINEDDNVLSFQLAIGF